LCYDEGRKMGLVYFGIAFVIILLIMKFFIGGNIKTPPDNFTDEDILCVAKEGKKIQAIKWYRSLHNTGLKEAKEVVEEMIKKS
jgi:hypothetical protein